MENNIILNGNDESILSILLSDILLKIDDGENYKWKLFFLEATTENDLDILGLEKKIRESESGYLISWKDLLSLSNQIHQTIEVLLIGYKPSQNLKKYVSKDDLKLYCEFYIELVDSSYWEISCKDNVILNKFKVLET